MTAVTQTFNLAHILSITTEILCPLAKNEDYPIRTVREILNFMIQTDGIDTFALPRVAGECRPYLIEQFPQLAHITDKFLMPQGADTPLPILQHRIDELIQKFGDAFEVRPIHPEDHQIIDPAVELAMLAPHIEVINVDMNELDNE